MRDRLFGYVLGALEAPEHEEVEKLLSSDARMCEELELMRKALVPLECDNEPHVPPLGLAESTCRRVAALRVQRAAADERGAAGDARGRRTFFGWSLLDVAVAAGILVAAGLLILPAISHSRFNAQVVRCQNNLQTIGRSLGDYANRNGDTYPRIPEGNLSVAGMYAPQLIQNGQDEKVFRCSLNDTQCAESARIPTMDELNKATPDELPSLLRRVGGSYAYTLGHKDEDNKYQPTKRQGRTNFVIMADAPCPKLGYQQSSNHGGSGQNVLYDDLHVRYVTTSHLLDGATDPDFYHNDAGQIAAGNHPNDAVLGCSDASPLGK